MTNNFYNDAYRDAHPEWKRNIGRWRFLSDSYLGGEHFKSGEYLTKYVLETDQEYQNRIDSTPLNNLCKQTVHTYTSFIYSQPIKRDISGLNPVDVELFMKDADLEGRSFDSFMRDVSIYSSVYGAVWVVVDKPSTPVNTLAEQQAAGIRPYVSMFTPENVIDWKFIRMPNGVYQLDTLKVVEDINGPVQIHKVYYRDRIDTIQVTDDEDDPVMLMSVPNPLGMIPAFPVYTARSPIRTLGISDIDDIADQQRAIAQELSEIEQSIRMNGHPSLVKTPSTEATAGAGAIIQMEENLDPGLKPYLLQPSSESIDGILNSIREKISMCDKMSHLETARGTRTSMSGLAMLVEQKMLTQKLAEKASNLCHGEEQLWGLFGRWQDTPWTGEVEYPMTFDQRDTTVTLQNIKLAKEANPMNPKLLEAIDNMIADTLIEDDMERQSILEKPSKDMVQHAPVTSPTDLVTHMREMVESGYSDQEIMDLHPEIAQLFNNNDTTTDNDV